MVRELLKQNRLKVHSSCRHTIQAFEMYSYSETTKGQSIANELPAHDYSDMLDAVRYVVMTDYTAVATEPKIHYSSQRRFGAKSVNARRY